MTLSSEEIKKYKNIAKDIRKDILRMLFETKSSHIGSCFSMVEILTALYFKILKINPENSGDPDRDRFILSKGHGVPALYPTLAKRGFMDKKTLEGFSKDGGTLGQHPDRDIYKGIEVTSGSLGHGLSIGAGMALAGKHDKKDYRVFVYLGDGELHEGSNWEAIMFSPQHKLDNLIAIIDYNKLQAIGRGEEIINLKPLKEKWEAFGWAVKEINGHDFGEIFGALEKIPFEAEKPSCIIANTIKGKGCCFMEDRVEWHDKCVDEKEYQAALSELG